MTVCLTYYAFFLIVFGSVLCLFGLSFQMKKIEDMDIKLFLQVNRALSRYLNLFELTWQMGRTWVVISFFLLFFLYRPLSGFKAGLCFGVAAAVERITKLYVNRPRPFSVLETVPMRQPSKPRDPSHPSGDAMRIWFMAAVLSSGPGLSSGFLALVVMLAVTVSSGRIAFGVHFPLDVIGGAGLGLLWAGIYHILV